MNGKLCKKCQAETAKIENSKMISVGIENGNEIDEKSLEDDIKTRNFLYLL